MDNPLLYISFLALLIKLVASNIFRKKYLHNQAGLLISLLLISSVIQSIIEFLGYYHLDQADKFYVVFMLKIYYVALTANLMLFPLVVSYLLFSRLSPNWLLIGIVTFSALSVILIFTDELIMGAQAYQYALSRIPGKYYWSYQALIVLLLSLTVYLLVMGKLRARTYFEKGVASNLIVGFLPFALAIITIVFAMAFGIKITAAGIFPVLIAIFILVICSNYGRKRILDLSVFIPFTKKSRLWVGVAIVAIQEIRYIDSSTKNLPQFIERELLLRAVELYDTQEEAAYNLNMSSSTLSRRLKKYRKLGF